MKIFLMAASTIFLLFIGFYIIKISALYPKCDSSVSWEKDSPDGSLTIAAFLLNCGATGKSGAPRQIDVLVRYREGLYEQIIIIECKYWQDNVSRLHVDALIAAVADLNASKGVMFSVQGFQEGAVTQAKHSGIELFKVRELTNEEWGLPGRVVELYLQFFQASIGNTQFPDAQTRMQAGTTPKPLVFNLSFDDKGPVTSTSLLLENGETAKNNLEYYLWESTHKFLHLNAEKWPLLNNGDEGISYFIASMNVRPDKPFAVPQENMLAILPKITVDVGIKVTQSKLQIDRSEKYLFSLAVESCLTGNVSLAARATTEVHTELSPLALEKPKTDEDVFKNGSTLKICLRPLFPFEELKDKKPVHLKSR